MLNELNYSEEQVEDLKITDPELYLLLKYGSIHEGYMHWLTTLNWKPTNKRQDDFLQVLEIVIRQSKK